MNCTPKVGQESQRKGCRNLWETPDRTKPITARKLGDDFDRAAVLATLEQNALRPVNTAAKRDAIPVDCALSSIEGPSGRYAPKQGAPQAPTIRLLVTESYGMLKDIKAAIWLFYIFINHWRAS